ncbi:MAG: glycosyltransferase [Paludibacteraceae bacterium]|nr:glycosyltransferase [Paludibacteraceae bacterium]
MNILFVFPYPINPSVGGVQRVTEVLTKELQRRGHHVVFLSYEWDEDYNFVAPHYFVPIHSWNPQEIQDRLLAIVREHSISIAICQVINSPLRAYIPSFVKVVSVCHIQPFNLDNLSRRRILELYPTNFRQRIAKCIGFLFPWLYVWYCERPEKKGYISAFQTDDKVCFISERFYPRLLKHIPTLPQHKLCAIHNPNTFALKVSHLQRENIVLFVGRMSFFQKNPMDFVRAWDLMRKKYPSWKAIAIGEGDTDELTYIRNYIQKHKIENIEFLGKRSDVRDFYERAKFVIIPSFGESWCMVLTEAMSCGCVPCVYDTYETLHDIVDDGQNGLITEPSPLALVKRLQPYMDDDIERERLSQNARRKVELFNVENIVEQWEKLLHTI